MGLHSQRSPGNASSPATFGSVPHAGSAKTSMSFEAWLALQNESGLQQGDRRQDEEMADAAQSPQVFVATSLLVCAEKQ